MTSRGLAGNSNGKLVQLSSKPNFGTRPTLFTNEENDYFCNAMKTDANNVIFIIDFKNGTPNSKD